MPGNGIHILPDGENAVWERYRELGIEYFQKEYPDLPEDDRELKKAFGELDNELERQTSGTHNPEFKAYKLAREKTPEYIKSYLFKIDFLRAERYNVQKAAIRILQHLHEKLELFGIEKLTCAICWDDLGDDVIDYFQRGALQILPERDERGRLVVFARGILNNDASKENILVARKACFYFWSTLTENDTVEGRLLGIVAIMWEVHKPQSVDQDAMDAVHHAWQSSPTRVSRFHLCQGHSSKLGAVEEFAGIFLDKWFRSSSHLPLLYSDLQLCQLHHGTEENCTKILVEYGCPLDSLAKARNVSYGGFIDQWIDERKGIDSQMKWLVDSIKRKISFSKTATTTSLPVSMVFIPKILNLVEEMYAAKMLVMEENSVLITLQSANLRVLIELTGGFVTFFEQPRFDCLAGLLGERPNKVSENIIQVGQKKLEKDQEETMNAEMKSCIIQLMIQSKIDLAARKYEKAKESLSENHKLEISMYAHKLTDADAIQAVFPGLLPLFNPEDFIKNTKGGHATIRTIERHAKNVQAAKNDYGRTHTDFSRTEEENNKRSKGCTIVEIRHKKAAPRSLASLPEPMPDDHFLDSGNDELDRAVQLAQEINRPPLHMNREEKRNKNGLIHTSHISDNDIKLGRGKLLQKHPGNIWFRNLIRLRSSHYERAERSEKTNISRDIVNIVKVLGRRFLKNEPEGQKEYWREITDEEAREKISIRFRTNRRG